MSRNRTIIGCWHHNETNWCNGSDTCKPCPGANVHSCFRSFLFIHLTSRSICCYRYISSTEQDWTGLNDFILSSWGTVANYDDNRATKKRGLEVWPQSSRFVEVHTNKLKFKAPATSSEPQIVLVSVNEGILMMITNDDDEGWGRGWIMIMIMMILNWYKFSLYLWK